MTKIDTSSDEYVKMLKNNIRFFDMFIGSKSSPFDKTTMKKMIGEWEKQIKNIKTHKGER